MINPFKKAAASKNVFKKRKRKMKIVCLLLTGIILLSGFGIFAAGPQETPDPIPQEQQNTSAVEQTGPKEQEAEPSFNLPTILFKGKVLKRQDSGSEGQWVSEEVSSRSLI